jgi:S1-C subfamily serine protease
VRVIARDPVYDLALLKVNAADGRLFSALPMGDSNQAAAGDMVLAVGNPLGLGHTVTSGIVSQTGRNLTNDAKNEGRHVEYIQTDTAINPGSSGGPLITLNGNWIAVNTAGITEAQGLGFSVPSAQVRSFLQSVIAGKGDLETP